MKFWITFFGVFLTACSTLPFPDSTCLHGDCINGAGKLTFSQDDTYTGKFVEGLPSDSNGTYESDEYRMRYVGGFVNGRFHGQGAWVSPNIIFEGSFEKGGMVSGTLSSKGMKIRVDEITDNVFLAQYTTGEGLKGEGKFEIDDIMSSQPGWVSVGNIIRVGRHNIEFPDGAKYQVEFVDGERDGLATWTSPDGQNDRVELWKDGVKIFAKPGPRSMAAIESDVSCALSKSHKDFMWFGAPCGEGMAEGKGIAYAKHRMAMIAGNFKEGELVQGVYKDTEKELNGRFQNLKLHGFGQHYKNGHLVFSGRYDEGKRGKGVCMDDDELVRCDHYDGQRIVEQEAMITDYQVDKNELNDDAIQASKRTRKIIDDFSDRATSSFERRDGEWVRARKRESQMRAFDQSMRRTLDGFKADLSAMAEKKRKTNHMIAHAREAQRKREQSIRRDYYAESLQRIEKAKKRNTAEANYEINQKTGDNSNRKNACAVGNNKPKKSAENCSERGRNGSDEINSVADSQPRKNPKRNSSSDIASSSGARSPVFKKKSRVYDPNPTVETGTTLSAWKDKKDAIGYARANAASKIVSKCRKKGARYDRPSAEELGNGITPDRWSLAAPDCKQGGWGGKEWHCTAKVWGHCYRKQ